MDIRTSKAVSMAEAKRLLSKRKEDGELGYEQSQALENCEKFSVTEAQQAEKLADKLAKEGKVSRELAIKIIDIRPATIPSLKAIVSKDKVELSEEDANAILKELS